MSKIASILMVLALLAAPCLAADKTRPADVDKAKAEVQAEKQERQKKCGEAIEKALKEYRCTMEVGMLVTTKANIPQVQLVPQD
jgi:hypothetical protein